MTGAAGILSSSAVPPHAPPARAHSSPGDETGRPDVNEQAAFSELFSFLDSDDAAGGKPVPERYETGEPDDGAEEADEVYAPLSAEIIHQKWFTDELDAPGSAAEAAPLTRPARPAVRLADPQAGATSEAMQQALSALVHATADSWPGPALPQDEEAGSAEADLPEQPYAAPVLVEKAPRPAPPPQVTPPEHRAPPGFMQSPQFASRKPLAPPQSPLTESDGAPPGIEASLSALESVLGGGNSSAATHERQRRSAAVREADLSSARHEPPAVSRYTRSPLGQIADRIVRELENLPAAPRRTG